MTTIASIGTGNMGGALLRGILASGTGLDIRATTNSRASAEKLTRSLAEATTDSANAVRVTSVESDPGANASAVDGADIVFLGVKPWMMADTLRSIADGLGADAIVVSMAAGVAAADLQALAPGAHIVRIMPNTPSAIGHGVIALAPAADVDDAHVEQLRTMLAGAGLVVPMTEADLPAMTGISGSGVAYFFLLAEALIKAGVSMGLSEDSARAMVVATADGAGRLLETKPDPQTLRESVSSKGGTTVAALSTFIDGGIFPLAEAAVRAAGDRSLEMEAENSAVING